MSPAELVIYAASRGVRLLIISGMLRCVSLGPLPEDLRDILIAHKAELLAHLGDPPLNGAESWDHQEACRLMNSADNLVERLQVDGSHSAIAEAAALVTSAYQTRDMETLRFAIAEFEAATRRVGGDRDRLAQLSLANSTPREDSR